MLNPFCRKSRGFLFLHFEEFSGIIRRIEEAFAGIVLASKFCLVGVALFGARALQKKTPGQKVPSSSPAVARPSNTSCLLLIMKMVNMRGNIRMIKMIMKIKMIKDLYDKEIRIKDMDENDKG